jgi:HK97 family phage major capsid protein
MTTKRLKELMEKRDAKAKEANAITQKAVAENRTTYTAEERAKIEALQAETEDIQATVAIETRQLIIEAQRTPFTSLSGGETRDLDTFDLGKAIRSIVYGQPLDGIEKEMCDLGRAEARAAGIQGSGLMLPQMLVQRRDMTATVGTDLQYGGNLVATQKMGILDALFNGLVLREAGATILTGLTGNFDWPAYVAPSAFAHKTEIEGSSEGAPETSMVSFSPKRLPGHIYISDQLLAQTGNVIEQVVRRNLIEQLSSQVEYFAIHGTGTTMPKGILATTGIGNVAAGTNGAVPTWTHVVAVASKVSQQNAARGTLHYLTNAWVEGQLKSTAKVASSDSRMILDDINGGLLNGYKPLFSNNVSHILTKGSSGAVCSPLIFGQFVDLVMAFWSGIEIDLIRDVTTAIAGKRALVFNLYHDANVVRPVSFSACKDLLTTAVN